jgi:K+-sensing histidine kinase KdpD
MAVSLPLIARRRTRPPVVLGIAAAIVCVVAETLIANALHQVAPVRTLGIVYLLGIVAVAAIWGLGLGMATAAISTIALDYFLVPRSGA